MPVTLELCENGYVLVYTISGRWDMDELIALFPQERLYRDSATHTVHALVDVRNVRNIPANMPNVRYASYHHHSTSGYVMLVGVPTMLQVFVGSIYRLAGFEKFKFCETLDEAWTRLRDIIAQESG